MSFTSGPWHYCGSERGGCHCMMVSDADNPIAIVTSGPWGDSYPAIRKVGDTYPGSIETEHDLGAGRYQIYNALIEYGSVPTERAKANAMLIAASPDLYKALADLVDVNERWNADVTRVIGRQPYWTDGYLDAARAALAKASGGNAND